MAQLAFFFCMAWGAVSYLSMCILRSLWVNIFTDGLAHSATLPEVFRGCCPKIFFLFLLFSQTSQFFPHELNAIGRAKFFLPTFIFSRFSGNRHYRGKIFQESGIFDLIFGLFEPRLAVKVKKTFSKVTV